MPEWVTVRVVVIGGQLGDDFFHRPHEEEEPKPAP